MWYYILAIVLFIAFNVIGRMDNLVGKIIRGWWNIGIKIVSFIPFMGWMTIFLINKGDGVKKEEWVKRGFESDIDAMDERSRQWEEENRRHEEQMFRQQQEKEENEQDIRRRIYQKTGNGNLQFNSDGSYVRRPGGEWERTSDVMGDL